MSKILSFLSSNGNFSPSQKCISEAASRAWLCSPHTGLMGLFSPLKILEQFADITCFLTGQLVLNGN